VSRRVRSAVLFSFLWINASYYYWDGGWSTGPRHLVPMLPLCCLALAFAWPRAFWARTVTLVLLAASLVLSLICAVAGMLAPTKYANPLVGHLPIFLTPKRLLKSVPIVLVWVAFGLLFFRMARPAGAYSAFIGEFFNGIGCLALTLIARQPLPHGTDEVSAPGQNSPTASGQGSGLLLGAGSRAQPM
jgi:hypothetical protein